MKTVVDESAVSEFIAKMRACFAERLAVTTVADKKAVERRMVDIMREYLGRSAWDAADEAQGVSHGTSRGRRRASVHRGGGRYRDGEFDHKLAQAGDRADD